MGQELTATQVQNRLRRKHSASRGKMQKPGTLPTIYKAVDKAVFVPMKGNLPMFFDGGLSAMITMMAGVQGLILRRYKRSKHEGIPGKA